MRMAQIWIVALILLLGFTGPAPAAEKLKAPSQATVFDGNGKRVGTLIDANGSFELWKQIFLSLCVPGRSHRNEHHMV